MANVSVDMNTIKETLDLISEQTGLSLTHCNYFTGLCEYSNGKYFNVMLDQPVFCSNVYDTLTRFANSKGIVRVEPNGYKRLAIFI